MYTRALTGLLDKVTVAVIEMLEQRQSRILDQVGTPRRPAWHGDGLASLTLFASGAPTPTG